MSKLFCESIDSSNNTVSTVFTSATFTALPLFVPWVQPTPVRKYRISFNGDSTSFIGSIVAYWRPEVSITNISNYTQPSNKVNLGSFWNYNPVGWTNEYTGGSTEVKVPNISSSVSSRKTWYDYGVITPISNVYFPNDLSMLNYTFIIASNGGNPDILAGVKINENSITFPWSTKIYNFTYNFSLVEVHADIKSNQFYITYLDANLKFHIAAISPTGSILWDYNTTLTAKGQDSLSISVAQGIVVLIVNISDVNGTPGTANLFGLNVSTGAIQWTQTISYNATLPTNFTFTGFTNFNGSSGVRLISDGTNVYGTLVALITYTGSGGGSASLPFMYGINPLTGTILWRQGFSPSQVSNNHMSPFLPQDNPILISSDKTTIYFSIFTWNGTKYDYVIKKITPSTGVIASTVILVPNIATISSVPGFSLRVVDGTNFYVSRFDTGTITAYNVSSGTQLWQFTTGGGAGATSSNFGDSNNIYALDNFNGGINVIAKLSGTGVFYPFPSGFSANFDLSAIDQLSNQIIVLNTDSSSKYHLLGFQ